MYGLIWWNSYVQVWECITARELCPLHSKRTRRKRIECVQRSLLIIALESKSLQCTLTLSLKIMRHASTVADIQSLPQEAQSSHIRIFAIRRMRLSRFRCRTNSFHSNEYWVARSQKEHLRWWVSRCDDSNNCNTTQTSDPRVLNKASSHSIPTTAQYCRILNVG